MEKDCKTTKEKAINIDYPRANETIAPGHYAVRITAVESPAVEAALDAGEYSSCQSIYGHWWHHLNGLTPGIHKVTVRAVAGSGESVSTFRRFKVK